MGSPTIFSGKFTKLLTQKGILNSNGSLNQYDGDKNYISHNNFETNQTTGWGLFTTTIASDLPAGTISLGATGLTLAPTSTNPISGLYSLQCSSAGVWGSGKGFLSDVFTLEREDLNKQITLQFSYEIASGSSNANWSGTLGLQSIIVSIYDVNAGIWIQPSNYLTMNTTTGVGVFVGSFTSSSVVGQQYRVAILSSVSTTGALALNFDNFAIGFADVVSVNGRSGAVVLDKNDVGLGNVDNVSLVAQDLAQKEPTGFENRTGSTISFDDFLRTFFIASSSITEPLSYWVKGVNYFSPPELAIGKQISNTTGVHYIYFDSAGQIQETTAFSPELFTNNCMIAIVYWNASTGSHVYFADERHGIQMDGATHGYLHTVFGTRYLSGLALQNFVPEGSGNFDVNAQFTSDLGTIRDEDILITIPSQSNFPVLYRDGTAWKKKPADSFPVIYNGTAGYTGTRIAYNNFSAGNWSLAEATDGNYVLMHIFATNDIETPIVAILGTSQYANAPQARAGAETEIGTLSGLPFAEFTAIGTVIFQTQSSYTNTPKARVVSSEPTIGEVYVDYRGEQLYTPSGVATSHSLLSNLDADDHLQYFNQSRGDLRYLQLTGGSLTGDLGVGVSSPISDLHVSNVDKVVSNTLYTSDFITLSAESTAPGFNIITSSDSSGHRGVFKSTRSRNTLDAPTAVQNGDQTLSIVGAGHDGTTNITTAGITFAVDGAVSTSAVPQAITFATGEGATRTERMRITSSGKVGINMIPTEGSATLSVKTNAIPSTAEPIAIFSVTDSSANLTISNGSTVDSVCVPSLSHTQANGNNNSASLYQGFIYNTDDTGTNPVHVFRAQTQTTLGVLAAVVTRPLYQFRNWTTNLITVLANGKVGFGTTTPSEVIDVVGNIKASGTLEVPTIETSNISSILPVDLNVTTPSINATTSNITVKTGDSNLQNSGDLTLSTGIGSTSSGGLYINTGGSANSGNIIIETGSGSVTRGSVITDSEKNVFYTGSGQTEIDSTGLKILYDNNTPSTRSVQLYGTVANKINLSASSSLSGSYDVILPSSAPETNSFLYYNGTNYIWKNDPIVPNMTGSEVIYQIRVSMGSSTLANVNWTSASGTSGTTALANFSSASTIGKIPHVTCTTTSTAGSTTGIRSILSYFAIGGGFRFTTTFMINDASSAPNARLFVGMNTTTSATGVNGSSNNSPFINSLTNFFCVGADGGAGDTNLCIYHNGNTAGGTTRIDLGSSFPITAGAEIYMVQFYNPPASNNIHYHIKGIVNNVMAEGIIVSNGTNLPIGSLLYMHSERFNGGSSVAVKLEACSLTAYTFG